MRIDIGQAPSFNRITSSYIDLIHHSWISAFINTRCLHRYLYRISARSIFQFGETKIQTTHCHHRVPNRIFPDSSELCAIHWMLYIDANELR